MGKLKTTTKHSLIRCAVYALIAVIAWTAGYMNNKDADSVRMLNAQLNIANIRLIVTKEMMRERSLETIRLYIRKANPKVYDELANHIAKAVYIVADKNNIPADLLIAIMRTESNFDPFAVSSMDAKGLMQIRLFNKKGKSIWYSELKDAGVLKGKYDIYDPMINAESGSYILAGYMEKEGSLVKAFGRYSGNAVGYADKVACSLGAIRMAQIEAEMKGKDEGQNENDLP